jgi:hypothetical protein
VKKVGCALKMSLNDLLKPGEAKSCARNTFGCRGDRRASELCKVKKVSDVDATATKAWAWGTMTAYWDKHNKA